MNSAASPRVTLRERQRSLVRESIVDAAYELFSRQPYSEVTAADIAEAAATSRATFFRYFADKQEVVFARQPEIRTEVAARELDREVPVPATLSLAMEQLRTIVVDVYNDVEQHPWQSVHERLLDENPELFDRHVRKLLAFGDDMAALLEHRGAAPDLAVLAAQSAVACCLAGRKLRADSSSMAEAIDRCFLQYT